MLDARRTDHDFIVDPFSDYASTTMVAVMVPNSSTENRWPDFSTIRETDGGDQLYAVGKRVLDILFAATFLLLSFPFLVLLAIMLQIDSPGSLFFVQRRIGRHGKQFGCIKFRTMHENAEQLLERILAESPEARREWEADHKLRNDPRISRLGGIVRKLSLDELPQLVNILRGEMSVVGPRPIVSAEVPKYGAFIADYCASKPGLTGLWQVSGRNDTTYDQRVQFDVEYRKRASLFLDISIIFRTLPAVLLVRGSY